MRLVATLIFFIVVVTGDSGDRFGDVLGRCNIFPTLTFALSMTHYFFSLFFLFSSFFRGRAMEERIPLLRGKVGSEAKGMDKKLVELSQEWEAGRPLSKDHAPSEVFYIAS